MVDVYIHAAGSSPWKVTYSEPELERRQGETDGWGDKRLVTNVVWMGDDAVMVSETNRVSDHFRGVLVDVTTQTSQVVRDDKIEEGWFEIVFSLRNYD